MILCHLNKIGVFFAPKTGSTSLHKLFSNYTTNLNKHDHITYEELFNKHPELMSYDFYAFYREPADRLLSALLFIKQKRKPDMFRIITGTNPERPDRLSEEQTSVVDNYSVYKMLENFSLFDPGLDLEFNWLLKPQINWLDHKSIQLLNFYDYDNEVRNLLLKFQFIPNLTFKTNTTVYPKDTQIVNACRYFAGNYYKQDYEFFKAKGIQFT
jgi:hypothetical protein